MALQGAFAAQVRSTPEAHEEAAQAVEAGRHVSFHVSFQASTAPPMALAPTQAAALRRQGGVAVALRQGAGGTLFAPERRPVVITSC